MFHANAAAAAAKLSKALPKEPNADAAIQLLLLLARAKCAAWRLLSSSGLKQQAPSPIAPQPAGTPAVFFSRARQLADAIEAGDGGEGVILPPLVLQWDRQAFAQKLKQDTPW